MGNLTSITKFKYFSGLTMTASKSLPNSTANRCKQCNKKILHMDTDDLSRETYRAILIEAEKFNHDLTLRFGVLAGQCKDEHDYIENAIKIIDYLRKADKRELSDIFFGDIPDLKALSLTLDKISNNIDKVKKMPIDKRHFDF